jgi:hypothetical protein
MATDIFDQLAELDAPPPPPVAFDRDLHQRLNQSLTTQHVFDLGLKALPFAALEFMRAIAGFASFTITGGFPRVTKDRDEPQR